MTVSALFLMGSIAVFLLGTFSGFMAHTLTVRLASDVPLLTLARLQYLLWGVGIFGLGALVHLPDDRRPHRSEQVSKLAFWLMFVGFNLAFFPTTLRRSQALLTDPARLFSPALGPEVSLGVIMFVFGTGLCLWTCAMARSVRS
jgi:heme/copper-type cytochrome/quinol oxidase subunit 1